MSENIYHINNLLHIIVGSIAVIGGLIALLTIKGSKQHKLAGKTFSILLIVAAVSSFYPTVYKFREIGPVAVITAVASIYLIITAVFAIRFQQRPPPLTEKFLLIVPLLLSVLPVLLVLRAFKTGSYEIFVGPVTLGSLFLYLLISDVSIIRNRNHSRDFWIKRHLTRMIFAFAFAMMAVLRLGLDLGVSFEVSLVLPVIGACALSLYFRRRFA